MQPTKLHNPSEFRDFNKWLNEHRHDTLNPYRYKFSFFDLDAIFFTIRGDCIFFQLVEVKTYGKEKLRPSQKVGLTLIDNIFKRCIPTSVNGEIFIIDGFDFRGNPKTYKVWYLGLHILSLSGTRPDNSDIIKWDGLEITVNKLCSLLRID